MQTNEKKLGFGERRYEIDRMNTIVMVLRQDCISIRGVNIGKRTKVQKNRLEAGVPRTAAIPGGGIAQRHFGNAERMGAGNRQTRFLILCSSGQTE